MSEGQQSSSLPEAPIPPPPRYSEIFESQDLDDTRSLVSDDGRVEISTSSGLFQALTRIEKQNLDETVQRPATPPPTYEQGHSNVRLNVCIHIVGSRGDVQPFIAIGLELVRRGHRVRIATHDKFQAFVLESGLEFYPIGGDPAELMAYMVKNPGLLPSMKSLREGDIQKKRKMIAGMLEKFWKSCIAADPTTGQPFLADAIIANPPSFAHIHCAQALGIPLHMVFTMPWSNTRAFPHPLVRLNLKDSAIPVELANYVSYSVVDWMTWHGLGDIINDWRNTLNLEPVPRSEGHRLLDSLKVPFTYCWSAALVPKPKDWSDRIDVCGFVFRDEIDYNPDKALQQFLDDGPAPIYIGFGSIVVEDPEKLTNLLLEAIKDTGVRAIISRGWSKLGANMAANPNILLLDDCPHEWLFKHVSTVIHHGGAGTTACGLKCERPTIIVPFFGDQQFWGDMVAEAGAGPEPIPYRQLTSKNLSDAIRYCDQQQVKEAAKVMAEQMKTEDGVQGAADSFLRHIPLSTMACDLIPSQPTSWIFKKSGTTLKLSAIAAEILLNYSVLKQGSLTKHESKRIYIDNNRWEPITAFSSSMMSMTIGITTSGVKMVTNPIEVYRDASNSKEQPESSDSQAEKSPKSNTFLKATAGSAKGLGSLVSHATKGMLVDVPLATTEGFRVAPRMYGSEVPDHGKVTDWKSGAVVAAKNFAYGMTTGMTDLYNEPAAGAKKDGVTGAVIGVGKGVMNMTVKTASAGLGLVTYPSQGLMKTIIAASNSTRKKAILQAVHERGQDELARTADDIDAGEVLRQFNIKLGRHAGA